IPDVTVLNEGSEDSLKVTWLPVSDATFYEVIWSLTDGTDIGTSGNLSVTEYTIPGLTSGTLYNVSVIAGNVIDEVQSDLVQSRTRPSPVADLLTESAATNESVSATWTKPTGNVERYIILCSNGTANPDSPILEDGSNSYMVSCEGLSTAGADYNITVTSQSGNENSNASTVPITALPNMVLIEAGNSTNSSFTAMWDHPAGEIDSFQVLCYDNDETPEIITDVGANLTYQVTCESLPTAGTGYDFSVVSVSGNKNATSKVELYTCKFFLASVLTNSMRHLSLILLDCTILQYHWAISCIIIQYFADSSPFRNLFLRRCILFHGSLQNSLY
ncbi:receptor-type tyrosine-protein phosphatase beta-like, partial [Lytechinus variegatus]|uniref:receptor-type tyrosine-protein phosphatase beta-like n=1 Tax=Lytechinus variegatus TaxID=7654 RepID=UPI001BB1FAE7